MQNNNIGTNDMVAVVTVTYNAEELLEETILSVINQSYNNIEYIIIDGASTDKTIDIIKKYEDKISYWVSETDDGLYFAMNKGIEKASGKWINFMNAGDTFSGNKTVEYVMQNKDRGAELIYGDYQIKESGEVKKAKNTSQWYHGMPFCHQALFTHADIMKKEPFDTAYRIVADHNFIISMYQSNKKFQYLDKTLAVFMSDGLAETNINIMNLESVNVLMRNNVPLEEIEKSVWYKRIANIWQINNLQKTVTKHSNTIISKEQNNKELERNIIIKDTILQEIKKAMVQMITIKALFSPIKKYKAYKKLIKKIKNDS